MGQVQPIPAGYPPVSPLLCVDGASAAIAFYGLVLGALERLRITAPDGRVDHAELVLGDAVLLLADELPEADRRGPRAIGGTPVTIVAYVDDVDEVFARALEAGATALRPVEDQYYGDRTGHFEDPFGHRWCVATHVEDVPPDEVERRARELGPEG